MPKFANAEEMISKWLEYCNLWIDHEFSGPSERLERSYVTDFDTESFHHGDHMFVSVHVDVDDELREAYLLGVYSDERDDDYQSTGAWILEYLAVEVDTDWRDIWALNTGFLNKPS